MFLHKRIPTRHLYVPFTDKSDDTLLLSSFTINPSIVFEKLISLKAGRSPGPDGWPAEVCGFQTVCRSVMCPSVYIFIKSLEWYTTTRLENQSPTIYIQKG